ncbi:M23 family metallopeptidase [Bacillus sp. SM2101]|uniref:M23 family metallopeptidase n=1 Tax=Bacillus sp. SM2101 TaxID=2805366 RepID=UPI0020330267|nr:M23 family metallopeptidase [Bacillus sp. SM2101]
MDQQNHEQENIAVSIAKEKAKKALKKQRNKLLKKAGKAAAKAVAKGILVLAKAIIGFIGSVGFPTIGTIIGVVILVYAVWVLLTSAFSFGYFDENSDVEVPEEFTRIHQLIGEEIETTYDSNKPIESEYRIPDALVGSILQIHSVSEDVKDLEDEEIIKGVVNALAPKFKYSSFENKVEWEERTCRQVTTTTRTYISCTNSSGISGAEEVEFLVDVETWNEKTKFDVEGNWNNWTSETSSYGGYRKERSYKHEIVNVTSEVDFTVLNSYLDTIGFSINEKRMIENLYEVTSKEDMGYSEWMSSEGILTSDNIGGVTGPLINDDPEISDGVFTKPTNGYITSGFKPVHRPDHYGVDVGSGGQHIAIWAVADGVVRRSYDSKSYGNVVFITHNIDGVQYETIYAHMTRRLVREGQIVTKGQQIGNMGNTGYSQGIHLHFELHLGSWNSNKSNALDPVLYGVPF